MFTESLFTIARIRKQPKNPSIHTHTHTHRRVFYSAIEKSRILPFAATWMNLKGIMLSEEKAMATHSSTLAWKIPWTQEPGRLQSMGL